MAYERHHEELRPEPGTARAQPFPGGSVLHIRTNAAEAVAQWERRAIRQLPFALARALTDGARAGREAIRAEMRRVFDRPTPFTLASFQIVPARRDRLEARIETKAQGAEHYLLVQERGGTRRLTRTEQNVAAVVPELGLKALVPAGAARLDRYGNWSAGERNQVLSALGAQRDRTANTTARSRRRNPTRNDYFIPDPELDGLAAHVYRRNRSGVAVVALILRRPPVYRARFDWRTVGERASAEAVKAAFPRRLIEATASAR